MPQSARKSRDVINTTSAGRTLMAVRACAHSAAYRPASSHGGAVVVGGAGNGDVVVVKSFPGPPSHSCASLSTATAAAAVATQAHPHTRTLVYTYKRTHTTYTGRSLCCVRGRCVLVVSAPVCCRGWPGITTRQCQPRLERATIACDNNIATIAVKSSV